MKTLNRKIAAFTAMTLLMGTMSICAFAAPGQGEAGIEFITGGNEIIDPPTDPDLGGQISNGDLDFGQQKLSGTTETYNSVLEGATGKQQAGFLLNAPHYDGWDVTVSIDDFKISGVPTMSGYTLTLAPWSTGAITTSDNATAAAAPVPATIALMSGASDKIFSAAKNNGFGKWGCNWIGDLEVIGGTATEGVAQATMLWSVTTTP